MDYGVYVEVKRNGTKKFFLAAEVQPTEEAARQVLAAKRPGTRIVPLDHFTIKPWFTEEEIEAQIAAHEVFMSVITGHDRYDMTPHPVATD